jgi:hypothetical protein
MIIEEERVRAGHTGDGVRAMLIVSTLAAVLCLLGSLVLFLV